MSARWKSFRLLNVGYHLTQFCSYIVTTIIYGIEKHVHVLSSDHWNITTPSIDRRLKLEVNICALMNSTYLRKTLKSYKPKHWNFTLVLRLISIFIINLLRHEVFSIMSLSVLFVFVFCFCSSETSDYAHKNCNFKEKLEEIKVIIRSDKSITDIQYNV
jgi:hypothetical protein